MADPLSKQSAERIRELQQIVKDAEAELKELQAKAQLAATRRGQALTEIRDRFEAAVAAAVEMPA